MTFWLSLLGLTLGALWLGRMVRLGRAPQTGFAHRRAAWFGIKE